MSGISTKIIDLPYTDGRPFVDDKMNTDTTDYREYQHHQDAPEFCDLRACCVPEVLTVLGTSDIDIDHVRKSVAVVASKHYLYEHEDHALWLDDDVQQKSCLPWLHMNDNAVSSIAFYPAMHDAAHVQNAYHNVGRLIEYVAEVWTVHSIAVNSIFVWLNAWLQRRSDRLDMLIQRVLHVPMNSTSKNKSAAHKLVIEMIDDGTVCRNEHRSQQYCNTF